ncbi:DUF1682-domain-containing protein [Cristinia sonorae]|uniref:DUF1682-domain-containing protein n=1 Tax=Cristinia sonorae TaxID=1940300 RepID=A0A8K0UVK9_9AGAR|nr:DUF1682-domain-containing protein [Cristinia sonorae]
MSFNPISMVVGALTPPPPSLTEDYDGLEYRWKVFTFRPALFQFEIFLLAAVLLYTALYFIGRSANVRRANKWFDAHLELYQSQFTKPHQKGGLTQDGNSDFFVFSTGRRAIKALHTTFTLRPRHDFFQLIYQTLWGFVELDYRVNDVVELTFTFKDSASVPDCVWAIVAKDELKGIRSKRWDLTFTKTTENPNLPTSLTVMSEFADITENLLKTHGPLSLSTVLSNPAVLPYFRSLSLTDQPRTRPYAPVPASERGKHLILSLNIPPSGTATLPLVQAVFQLVDIIAGEGGWGIGKSPLTSKGPGVGLNGSLRPETRSKLKKAREELDKELKEELAKEKREEQAEEKAAAKRKAEEERLSRLSASEQKKALEREKKRLMRKTQGKTKVR